MVLKHLAILPSLSPSLSRTGRATHCGVRGVVQSLLPAENKARCGFGLERIKIRENEAARSKLIGRWCGRKR